MTDSAERGPELFGETEKGYQATVRILDLLDKLAAVESLRAAATAAGVGETQMREALRQAATMIRGGQEASSARSGSPDWRDLSVAEALSILADHGIGKSEA